MGGRAMRGRLLFYQEMSMFYKSRRAAAALFARLRCRKWTGPTPMPTWVTS